MRVSTNAYLDSTLLRLNSLNRQMKVQQEQITTGQKISKLEDDPASAARVMNGQAEQAKLVQFRDNSAEAKILTDLTGDSLGYLKNLSEQAQAIAQNPSLWESPNAFADQVDSIIEDALSVANSRHENEYLFAGSATNAEAFSPTRNPLTNEIEDVVYNGDEEGRSFEVSDGVSVSPFADGNTNREIGSLLNNLIQFRDALRNGAQDAATTINGNFEAAEDALVESLSENGLKQFRLEVLNDRNSQAFATLSDRTSSELAVDQTEVIVEMMNSQRAYEGALRTTSKMMELSLLQFI